MNGQMFGGLVRMMKGQAPQFGFRAMFNKQPGMTNDSGMAPPAPFAGKDMRQVNPGPPPMPEQSLNGLMQARQNGMGHLAMREAGQGQLSRMMSSYGQPFGGPAVYY
jgi:hypothetical protein